MKLRRQTVAVVLHHTQGSRDSTLEELRDLHMRPKHRGGRGWEEIGYHYVIRHGEVLVGRPADMEGAHAYSEKVGAGRNHDTIGVAVTGNYLQAFPAEDDMAAVAKLVDTLRDTWGKLGVLSHREAMASVGDPAHTDCPGSAWVEEIRHRMDVVGVGADALYLDQKE